MNTFQLFFWRCLEFYRYFVKSKSQWRIHSPFMFAFYNEVILKRNDSIGKKFDTIRSAWEKSTEMIEIQDFGAGYNQDQKKYRHIPLSQVVKSSARKKNSGIFLYNLILFLKPKRVLELGGNLGFSGLYLAEALQTYQGSLFSVEGDYQLTQKARTLHTQFGFQTQIYNQLFDSYLSENHDKKFDLILLDGHHESQATEQYLQKCLTMLSPGGLFILDDIRWNPDMLQVWQKLKENPNFTLTAETFQMGFIWPDKIQAKEHFILWNTILS